MDSLAKKTVDAEIHQIIQIFGSYLNQLNARKYYDEVELKLSAMDLRERKRVLY